MYIRSVDLPDQLVQAHRDGQLVLFVGAGASRDAPASLPDFRGLTRNVLQEAEAHDLLELVPEDREQPAAEPLDTILGRLDERPVDVHRLVSEQLSISGGRPNALHHAIVALADSGGSVRIVTSNYDLYLSTALAEIDAGSEVEEYRSPALPMGNDFEGLVYLHGALTQDPRHLVVTDEDFGRAYLRDAWAARFLERMYATYTVLFVGYSHGDVVMRYLARSLSTAQPRYAFTDQPDQSDWRSLHIDPIGYELVEESHERLPEAINGWATEVSRGLLDHRQRVRELVQSPSSGVPEEESYLEATLTDPDRVRFFAEFANHEQWLPWAARRPEFRQLFDPHVDLDEPSRILAQWFVDRFVLPPDRSGVALATLHDAGGRLSDHLWRAIAQGVWRSDESFSPYGAWLVLLLGRTPPGGSDLLEQILNEVRLPEEREVALLLFEHLTRPVAAIEGRLTDTGARVRTHVLGDGHWLREAWSERLVSELPGIAPQILSIADQHLTRAHQLRVAATGERDPFDPLAVWLPAISEGGRAGRRSGVEVLVEAARDSLEAALAADMPAAVSRIDTWGSSGVALLRRLAVHGATMRQDLSDGETLDWLLDHGLLFDHPARTEVFALLRDTAEDIDDGRAVRLVDEIRRGPSNLEDDTADRARYDRLTWLCDAAHQPPAVLALLEEIQDRHPEWQATNHPDRGFVIETGWREPQPPMTTSELHERIVEDAHRAMTELNAYRGSDRFDRTTWHDVTNLIADTVRQYPSDGLALLEQATPTDTPFYAAVIHGWSRAELDDDTAKSVLARLLALSNRELTREIADLLAQGTEESTDWPAYSQARQLAGQLWESISDSDSPQPSNDWLSSAINHPAGMLAQFWLRAVSHDWKVAGDAWDGLSEEHRAAMEQMLADGRDKRRLTEPVLASQLRLLHGADPDWAIRHILPLLDWSRSNRAIRAWHGFLYWGRPTAPLLHAGLLDHYLATAEHADRLPEELQRELAKHLAGLATSSEPPASHWVARLTTLAEESVRAQWLDAIGWMLPDLPRDQVAAQWDEWMRPYWEDRLRTVPIALTRREASAMAGWVPHLGLAVPEAVSLVVQQPASLDDDRGVLREFEENLETLEPQAVAIAEVLAHLLLHTSRPFWDCRTLRNIFRSLTGLVSQDALTPIREQALRLGCTDATDW